MKNSNLPVVQEEGVIGKIKNFFRSIIAKFKGEQPNIEEIQESSNIENGVGEVVEKVDFKKELKAEVEQNYYTKKKEKEEFINNIEENPELLESLSIERLEKLNKYYDEVIEEDKLKLETLKRKLA